MMPELYVSVHSPHSSKNDELLL